MSIIDWFKKSSSSVTEGTYGGWYIPVIGGSSVYNCDRALSEGFIGTPIEWQHSIKGGIKFRYRIDTGMVVGKFTLINGEKTKHLLRSEVVYEVGFNENTLSNYIHCYVFIYPIKGVWYRKRIPTEILHKFGSHESRKKFFLELERQFGLDNQTELDFDILTL